MTAAPSSRSTLTELLRLLGLVVVGLALVDVAVLAAVGRTSWLTEATDLQTPSQVHARIATLRGFDGYRAVLLGDSVVLGAVMGEYGDEGWRGHELGSHLERGLEAQVGPTMVLNMGMNGALPVDVERLVDLTASAAPDLVVIDINLRSYSDDFRSADAAWSRAWLERLTISAQGRYRLRGEGGPLDGFEQALHSAAVNTWGLYRLRDALRWRLLGGEPRDVTTEARDQLRRWARGEPRVGPLRPASELDPFDPQFDAGMATLMQAKTRLATVDPAPDHPQRLALERLLRSLAARDLQVIVFYATENPEMLPELYAPGVYDAKLAEIETAIRPLTGPRMAYLGPKPALLDGRFLDHAHLDAEGNQLLAGAILGALPRE
jgi:hypothetical protein